MSKRYFVKYIRATKNGNHKWLKEYNRLMTFEELEKEQKRIAKLCKVKRNEVGAEWTTGMDL